MNIYLFNQLGTKPCLDEENLPWPWGGGGWGGGVLLGILGGSVPPGTPNANPISDQKM